MYLRIILMLFVLFEAGCALDLSSFIPTTRQCSVSYGTVLKEHDWVCKESQFQQYPKAKVDNLLMDEATYGHVNEYLQITKNCQSYHDNNNIYGENEYYTYESICQMNRIKVNVIWAKVPDYIVPAEFQNLNGGLLPCHVLEGQSLYDVECVHPWANGIPKHYSRRIQRRLKRIKFNGIKRNLCLVGYSYNYNMMCKPTGYMTREVLVYSEHANKIFNVVVPDVPTSCACAYCKCNSKGGIGHAPAIV